jgi:hypothetical protein
MRSAALLVLLLPLAATAATPQAELKALTAKLKAAPDDAAARGRVIALAATLKPAVPEEAREPFVMGATVLKESSDAGKAVDYFTKAIVVAPWFADAYYNRALAEEAAGRFDAAVADLTLYLKFKLPAADKRSAQDKVYALKAKAALAGEKRAAQDAVDRAERDRNAALQAKRDVIESIKKAVNGRMYNSAILSADQNKPFAGISQAELAGRFYQFGNYDHYIYYWKFTDDRAEVWVTSDNGYAHCDTAGTSFGPSINDMRWYNGCSEQQWWGRFDLATAELTVGVGGGSNRPLSDAAFDPGQRYNYTRYSPP